MHPFSYLPPLHHITSPPPPHLPLLLCIHFHFSIAASSSTSSHTRTRAHTHTHTLTRMHTHTLTYKNKLHYRHVSIIHSTKVLSTPNVPPPLQHIPHNLIQSDWQWQFIINMHYIPVCTIYQYVLTDKLTHHQYIFIHSEICCTTVHIEAQCSAVVVQYNTVQYSTVQHNGERGANNCLLAGTADYN